MKKPVSETKIFIGLLKDINFSIIKLSQNLDRLINATSSAKKQTHGLSPVGLASYSGFPTIESPVGANQRARQKHRIS